MEKESLFFTNHFSISLKHHLVLYYIFLIIAPFLLVILLSVSIMYRYTCRIYGRCV